MRFGLAPIQSRARFDVMHAQAGLAEALGFDVLWAHEHHSGGTMYPSPLMTLAALAGVTRRIELGTNMLLLPLHHPLRVAEDAAMVDVMSGGRLRLGVSAGYSPADLQAFAVSPDARAKRMREGLSLIRAVWTGAPVSLDSELCQLRNFTLHPKPIRQPAPPIYMGGTVDAAIRRVARLGDELIISATQRISDVPRMLAVYAEALRATGQQLEAKTPAINRIVHVLPDGAPKQNALAFFTKGLLASYDAWGHQNVTSLDADARSLEQTDAEHLIIGDASFCIDAIERYRANGIKEIACLMNFGGPEPEAVERSIRLFGEKVMPRVSA
jgi:alkanesulfonate monooxygenase SsuD/methylene tetrahydromethanopterin reductase-like flavin-dependent oxidoreductase (luciferase family)